MRAFSGAGGHVTFANGSLLDVGFLGAANFGTFTVMTWEGTPTNNGLRFVETVDTSIWSFKVGDNSLTETAAILQERKVGDILSTGSPVVATCNPGCHLQLLSGLRQTGAPVRTTQPVSLLAQAYRTERGN
jgi:hypothetical protein